MATRKVPPSDARITPELFKFLRELKANNSRPWFEKNKPRYEQHVKAPLLQFIADFAPKLRKISPQLVADPRPNGGSMFRIYRDVRFSKDKSPYKTFAAVQFRHAAGKDVHAPGFYLHLDPEGVFAAGGMWHPESSALAGIRKRIADDPKAWKRVISGKAFKEGTLRLEGDALKRPPRGFDPEHPFIDDLRRKDFITVTDLTQKAACSKDFVDRYADICKTNKPFMKFLTESVGVAF